MHSTASKERLTSRRLMQESTWFRDRFGKDRQDLFVDLMDFSKKRIAPHLTALHRGEKPYSDMLKVIAEYRGFTVPEDFGGMGMKIVDSVMMREALAYGSPSVAVFFEGHELCQLCIMLGGNEVQMARYLPELAKEDGPIGCYALSDVNCGSDVANMTSMKFSMNGGIFMLDGEKNFITNGPIANLAVVFAVDPTGQRYRNITAFLVPSKIEGERNGFEHGKPMIKTGWVASPTSSVSFSDVKVLAEDVVGEVGQGFALAVTGLNYGRLKVAAGALGLMERALDETVAFVLGRMGVGGPLRERDVVISQIDEVVEAIEATRHALYDAAFYAEGPGGNGTKVPDFSIKATIAKNIADVNVERVAAICSRLHGGAGMDTEMPIAVLSADSRMYAAAEGPRTLLGMQLGKAALREQL
jgi:alkylation response protein AidB-like acyl-CoA dehydrogenase